MLHRWEVGQCATVRPEHEGGLNSSRVSGWLCCVRKDGCTRATRAACCRVDRDYRVDGLTVALSEDTDTPTMGNTKIENGSAEIICLLVLDCCGWADMFLPRRLQYYLNPSVSLTRNVSSVLRQHWQGYRSEKFPACVPARRLRQAASRNPAAC